MAYSFDEHKHRYAVWTAARAVQRSFAKTLDIENAINCTDLKQFSESVVSITQDTYDAQQKEWCGSIMQYFNKEGEKEICSYGRASKIIAIYLKTSVILPNRGETATCLVIHPPIDRKLLDCLTYKKKINGLLEKPWTKFEEEDYFKIVEIIKANGLAFNWTLEEYWDSNPKRKG